DHLHAQESFYHQDRLCDKAFYLLQKQYHIQIPYQETCGVFYCHPKSLYHKNKDDSHLLLRQLKLSFQRSAFYEEPSYLELFLGSSKRFVLLLVNHSDPSFENTYLCDASLKVSSLTKHKLVFFLN